MKIRINTPKPAKSPVSMEVPIGTKFRLGVVNGKVRII